MYIDEALIRTNALIETNLNFVAKYFKAGDVAITLTWKPHDSQYKQGYKPDTIKHSADIRHFLRRANLKLLGRDYKSRDQKLRVVNTFELNSSQGLHCHMLLGIPDDLRVNVSECINTLMQCWLDMNCSGYVGANKIEICDDPRKWIKYFLKDSKGFKTEFTDYYNWNFN